MKIILSRKGFDSGYAGYPSPILPNGELISLPIPDFSKDIRYEDLIVSDNIRYSDIIEDLIGSKICFENHGKVDICDVGCHFDPDINRKAYERLPGWYPIFGQAGAARSHLANQGVGVGDLFLFFGWFRQTEIVDGKLRYSKEDKQGRHIIYGYLQVGDVHKINTMDAHDWMLYHPHVRRGATASDGDYVFVASSSLSFNNNLEGAGMFRFSDEVVLTKDNLSRTKWDLPKSFREVKISYHSKKSWKDGYFQSAAKGQEFVIEANEEIEKWAKDLVASNVVESSVT